MKRLLVIIVVFIFLATSASASESRVGASGAQFLKIGVGSRYQGLGEASTAVVNDVYSMYWNPAGLSEIEQSSISFTNVDWLLDIKLNYFAFAKNFEDVGVFGVSATMLSMGDQEVTTFADQGGTGESFTASSYAIGITYARHLTTRFSFGVTAKYIGERIYNESSQGFAFDFGTLLYTGFRNLRLGMSITNMGPELKFAGPDLTVGYDLLTAAAPITR